MTPFTELGQAIETRWQAARYETQAFSAIAQTVLAEQAVTERISHEELIDWAMRNTLWPAQSGSRFGQPPLNVFIGSKFYIEVLTWVESTTSVHQHNFSGAFQVLQGSSMHSRYRFDCDTRIDNRLLLGKTQFLQAELLTRGSIRPILSGDRMIHALFHLEHPSATIVVRTMDDASGPQYNYEKPGLAIDPFYAPEPFMTQSRLLRMLASIDSPQFPTAIQAALNGSDAWTAYRLLEIANTHLKDPVVRDAVLDTARQRHGALIDQFVPCLAEATRQANITTRRGQIKAPDHRFFLALLLNLPDRASILDMVRARFPAQEPVTWLVEQVRQLTAEDQIGLTFDALSLTVLDTLLRDQTLEALNHRLARQHAAPDIARQQNALQRLMAEIRSATLFQPLFA